MQKGEEGKESLSRRETMSRGMFGSTMAKTFPRESGGLTEISVSDVVVGGAMGR